MNLDEYLALEEGHPKLAKPKGVLQKTLRNEQGWTRFEALMQMAWCLAALGRFDEALACVRPVLEAEGVDDEGNDVSGFAFESAALHGWIAMQKGEPVDRWRELASKHERDWVYPLEELEEHLEYVRSESVGWALDRSSSVLSELAVQLLLGEAQSAFDQMLEALRARLG